MLTALQPCSTVMACPSLQPGTAELGANGAVQDFLVDIQASDRVNWGGMAPILVSRAAGADEVAKLIALRWLREFVELAKAQLLPHYASILEAVLPSLAHPSPELAAVRPAVANLSQLLAARVPHCCFV